MTQFVSWRVLVFSPVVSGTAMNTHVYALLQVVKPLRKWPICEVVALQPGVQVPNSPVLPPATLVLSDDDAAVLVGLKRCLCFPAGPGSPVEWLFVSLLWRSTHVYPVAV